MINFKLKNVSELFKRRYKLLNIGLEIITNKKKNLYLTFLHTDDRDLFYKSMMDYVEPSCITAEHSIVDYTYKWVNGELTNFDYLLLVNSYA